MRTSVLLALTLALLVGTFGVLFPELLAGTVGELVLTSVVVFGGAGVVLQVILPYVLASKDHRHIDGLGVRFEQSRGLYGRRR